MSQGLGESAVAARDLAVLVVEGLHLEDVNPAEVDLRAPLFGGGLDLDSLDMLEISLLIQQRYGVKLKADDPDNETIFASLQSLADHIGKTLAARSFADFSALLESIHASVHTWVGGAMTLVSVAAYDPLFWAHHAMIDRLWYLWQIATHGRPPASILDSVLTPFSLTVADTLDIGRLGYGYAVRVVG